MGQPTSGTRDGEENGEVVGGESHGFVDETRVEVDVGVEVSLLEVLVAEGDALELDSDLNEGLTSKDGEYLFGNLANDAGAGVIVLVHAVSETHELDLAGLDLLDESRDVALVANILEHSEDSLVGTTMTGSIQGSARSTHRGVDIDSRGSEVTHTGGTAVELVVGVEDKEDIKGLGESGVRTVVGVAELVKHVEEVLGVGELVCGGVNVRTTDTVTISKGRNSGHGSNDTMDLLVSDALVLVEVLSVESRVGLGVEGGHGGHGSDEHSHGVRIVAVRLHHGLEILVDVGVTHDTVVEVVQLALWVQKGVADVCIKNSVSTKK